MQSIVTLPLQPAAWYSAAEAAVAAIYALHPAPGSLCAAVVHRLAGPAIGDEHSCVCCRLQAPCTHEGLGSTAASHQSLAVSCPSCLPAPGCSS